MAALPTPLTAAVVPRPHVPHGRPRVGALAAYLLLAPALLLLLGILAYPIVFNVWLSLTDAHDSQASGQFIGLA
ncbi:MAG TPA: sugar ABC transporter permease, partial [Chloroflexota bacterium]